MNTLTIKLKQHTPLIHFQHDQDGATLRASEVKPRLDKYILTQLGAGDYENGKADAKAKGWLVGKGEHPALDYKMRIIALNLHNAALERNNELPMYFGNMNSDNPKGKSECLGNNLLQLSIISKRNDLLKEICKYITDFFLMNNFGTRQSKGYGSFSVKAIDNKPVDKEIPYGYISYFNTSGDDIFTDIEWIHKTLRSGINGKSVYSLYFKSLLFSYSELEKQVWDKKSIKSHFLSEHTKKTVESTRDANLNDYSPVNRGVVLPPASNPLMVKDYQHWRTAANKESGKFDMRDYLGFSTNEVWMAYDTGVFELQNGSPKTRKIKDNRTNKIIRVEYVLDKMKVSKSMDSNFIDLGRFKSPILYKPIQQDNGSWRVFVFANDSNLSALNGKVIYYKSNMPEAEDFSLVMWPDFSVCKFLKWAFSLDEKRLKTNFSVNRFPFNPEKHKNKREIDCYNKILKLYYELRNNLN